MENGNNPGNDSKNQNVAKNENATENTTISAPSVTSQPAKTETNSGERTTGTGAADETAKNTNAPEANANPEYRPQTSGLGNDEDGTPKISAHPAMNVVGKKILELFKEREGTNLPKITGSEIKKMLRDQGDGMEVVFQFSDEKKLRGRMVLKAGKEFLELPMDINEEFNFGPDFEAMAEEARAAGKEWTEKEEAEAREKAELDEKDKNRLSMEKLNGIGEEITRMFEERGKTNLPGITEKEIHAALKNHVKSIGIEVKFENEECTQGYVNLTEFSNVVRVPAEGSFTFGIDYQTAAKKMEAAAVEKK